MNSRSWFRLKQNAPKLSMLAYMVLFFIFLLGPILIVVAISFTETEYVAFPPKGFSLRWYERFFEYDAFVDSFIVSVELAIATAVLGVGLGVPAALAVTRGHVPVSYTHLTLPTILLV